MATDDIARALAIKAIQGGGGGTNVVANPTLAGTEAALTGIEVGDTKYKVEQPIPVEYEELFDDNVVISSTPVTPLSLGYVDIGAYPINKMRATVNGKLLIFYDGRLSYSDDNTLYVIYTEDGLNYVFGAVNPSDFTPLAGTYSVYIEGVYDPDESIVISNLECNKPFAVVADMHNHNRIKTVTNPDGQTAVSITCDASSFSAVFMTVLSNAVHFIIYTLDSDDQITTVTKTTNITLS